MKIIKKVLASLIIGFFSTSISTAKTVTINESKFALEEKSWNFLNDEDGFFFILGPQSSKKLIIKVHSFLSNGNGADPITVHCNASRYRVLPGEKITCYGNYADVIYMSIAKEDFKNGSQGIYEHVPLSVVH